GAGSRRTPRAGAGGPPADLPPGGGAVAGAGAGGRARPDLLSVWSPRQLGAGARRCKRTVELRAARRLGGTVLARGGPGASSGAREELPAAESRGRRVPDHGVWERRARARAAILAGPTQGTETHRGRGDKNGRVRRYGGAREAPYLRQGRGTAARLRVVRRG